jgi:hypothetical protein
MQSRWKSRRRCRTLVAPPGAQRLQCRVELEGDALGDLELPVCDGQVPRHIVADAISARFHWPILGRFFANTVYAQREVGEDGAPTADAHDEVGWTVFLQELWGRPGWPAERFYDAYGAEPGLRLAPAGDGWLTVEASDELPDVELGDETVEVVFTVGGAAIALIPISGSAGPGRLRAAVTRATGTELCQAAVREGLLGAPLGGGPGLRERLAAAAKERPADRTRCARAPSGVVLSPGSAGALSAAPSDGRPELVLGRRDGPAGYERLAQGDAPERGGRRAHRRGPGRGRARDRHRGTGRPPRTALVFPRAVLAREWARPAPGRCGDTAAPSRAGHRAEKAAPLSFRPPLLRAGVCGETRSVALHERVRADKVQADAGPGAEPRGRDRPRDRLRGRAVHAAARPARGQPDRRRHLGGRPPARCRSLRRPPERASTGSTSSKIQCRAVMT